jgi:hypothetical protein
MNIFVKHFHNKCIDNKTRSLRRKETEQAGRIGNARHFYSADVGFECRS